MEKNEMIELASKCFAKKWSYEELKYGDDLYGQESMADEVWEYVTEIEDGGTIGFTEKYRDCKMYWS